jgi:hypothetical protein
VSMVAQQSPKLYVRVRVLSSLPFKILNRASDGMVLFFVIK